VQAKCVGVIDNNCIDREVSLYNPTHVIVEALWVVPSKFTELIALHPTVKWNVRVHSKTPFLAHEGMAINWIAQYLKLSPNLSVSGNNYDFVREIEKLFLSPMGKMHYLPNIYNLPPFESPAKREPDGLLKVACFGAVRPMKNHLQQAVAAHLLASELKLQLEFHINERTEQGGSEVLKNLQALFAATGQKLVTHPWYNHSEFIKVVRTMDIGTQVSMSESFNIVTADFISQNIPIIVSYEMEWMHEPYKANPNSAEDITYKMRRALLPKNLKGGQIINYKKLKDFSKKALNIWIEYVE
jgi:hypothetical protein